MENEIVSLNCFSYVVLVFFLTDGWTGVVGFPTPTHPLRPHVPTRNVLYNCFFQEEITSDLLKEVETVLGNKDGTLTWL